MARQQWLQNLVAGSRKHQLDVELADAFRGRHAASHFCKIVVDR